jgi:hypothetical protein
MIAAFFDGDVLFIVGPIVDLINNTGNEGRVVRHVGIYGFLGLGGSVFYFVNFQRDFVEFQDWQCWQHCQS